MDVIQEISPNDEMIQWPPLGGGREQYFELGDEAVRIMRRTLRAAGLDDPGNILDLPCGHGRVLRTLKAAFPEAHLTACDIDRDGVDFCARTFGAEPVYSAVDPRDITFARNFDVIWCGSLLTHLPAERFVGFLELFESCLSPNGLLVFTTSGAHAYRILCRLLPDRQSPGPAPATAESAAQAKLYFPIPDEELAGFAGAYETEGFAYYEVLDNFGTSLSSPAWVCKQLERLPSLRLVTYLEQGWGQTQDVVACQRR